MSRETDTGEGCASNQGCLRWAQRIGGAAALIVGLSGYGVYSGVRDGSIRRFNEPSGEGYSITAIGHTVMYGRRLPMTSKSHGLFFGSQMEEGVFWDGWRILEMPYIQSSSHSNP